MSSTFLAILIINKKIIKINTNFCKFELNINIKISFFVIKIKINNFIQIFLNNNDICSRNNKIILIFKLT